VRTRFEDDVLRRVAAFVLLVSAGLYAVLVAARLAAAAADRGFSPFAALPGPSSHAGWAVLALAGSALVVVLLVVLTDDEQPAVRLQMSDGGVSVPATALERRVQQAVEGHADIVRAAVAARGDGRSVTMRVRVSARPLADGRPLAEEVRRRSDGALRPILGARLAGVDVQVRVLAVRALVRKLP
jgi:hypothetical protein